MPDIVYFITSNTYQKYPYFKESIFCDLLIEELGLLKQMYKVRLYGFVINYDHLHWLPESNKEYNISKITAFLKRHTSRNINLITGCSEGVGYSEDVVSHFGQSDLQQQNKSGSEKYKKLLQEFDKYVEKLKNEFISKYGVNQAIFPKFKWQRSFNDRLMRSEQELKQKIQYIHFNP